MIMFHGAFKGAGFSRTWPNAITREGVLGSVPTVWDTTVIIDAKLGDYIITARRKGDDWFIGAMSDWTARELTITLSFLHEGNYEAEICEDGINADRYPSDYTIRKETVNKKTRLPVKMAPGGGWLMRLSR